MESLGATWITPAIAGSADADGDLTISSTTDATKGWVHLNGNVHVNQHGLAIGDGVGDPTAAVPLKIAANQILLSRFSNAAGGSAQYATQRGRGTIGSPSAVQSGDILFQFMCDGYGSTGMSSAGRASIYMYANETWTDTAQGSAMAFRVTPNGTASDVEQVRITDQLLQTLDGLNVQVGTTTGTKIGTSTGQKLGFHNATPTAQRSGAAQAAVSTTSATNSSPYGFTTAAQANAIITLLNEIRSCLVEKGLMKGSA